MKSENPLHGVWLAIRSRCHKPHDPDFALYGARGIRMCRRWRDAETGFRRFLLDVGPRPPGMVLARIDTRRGYGPANVRWTTRADLNRRTRWVRLTIDLATEIAGRLEHGERQASIARRLGVSPAVVGTIRHGKAWREVQPLDVPPLRP